MLLFFFVYKIKICAFKFEERYEQPPVSIASYLWWRMNAMHEPSKLWMYVSHLLRSEKPFFSLSSPLCFHDYYIFSLCFPPHRNWTQSPFKNAVANIKSKNKKKKKTCIKEQLLNEEPTMQPANTMPLKCTRNINASLTFKCRYTRYVCGFSYRILATAFSIRQFKMRMIFLGRCICLHHLLLAWPMPKLYVEMWQRPNRKANGMCSRIVITSQVFYFKSCLFFRWKK